MVERMKSSDDPNLIRWRLVLGRYSNDRLPQKMNERERRIEQALDFLYSREYRGRGVREDKSREGSLDPSQLSVPT
jgi:hypothetical protein